MSNHFKTRIKKKIKNEEDKISNLANFGNSMINSNSFNIKNYLRFLIQCLNIQHLIQSLNL